MRKEINAMTPEQEREDIDLVVAFLSAAIDGPAAMIVAVARQLPEIVGQSERGEHLPTQGTK